MLATARHAYRPLWFGATTSLAGAGTRGRLVRAAAVRAPPVEAMLACPPQPASARAASSGGSSRRTISGLNARCTPRRSDACMLEVALPAVAGTAGTAARGVTPAPMRAHEHICVCTRFRCPGADHREAGVEARHVHAANLRRVPVFPPEHRCERPMLASARLARVRRADGRRRIRRDSNACRHERRDGQPPRAPRDPVSPHRAKAGRSP